MFIVGCRGERVGGDERLLFEEYAFGGFILFRDNCREPRQISSLCRQLWHTTLNTPPFIAIDQEGGRVHRLPSALHPFSRCGGNRRAPRPRSGLPLRPRRGHRIGTGWNQPQLCSGTGCKLESAESHYRRSLVRQRAGASDRYEFSLAAWPARRGSYPLRQTLSRPWRHRAGFPPGPSRGDKIS